MKLTFLGAGSTVFVGNVIGDCMCSEALRDSVFALYDIDAARIEESRTILEAIRKNNGGYGRIECFIGEENRKAALSGADFVVNAIQIGGNVLNTGHLISNLPEEACVEIPCLVNGSGISPCSVGPLPVQCAAMNMTNINVQLLTIEAAVTKKKAHIYQTAMLDPHTGSELDIDTIQKMVDDLIEAHGDYLPKYQ